MSVKKPLYLLAGGRGGKSNDSIFKAVFKDIGKTNPTIAYVGVASYDNRDFFRFIGAMIKKVDPCKLVQVIICPENADLKKAREILESADAVFMSGGDVEAGIQVLIEKKMTDYFQGLYEQGKLFFGASAGSIMMADRWVRWRDPEDDSTAKLFACLGLAPIICDTHAEDDDWEELKAALKLAEDDTIGYGIASGTAVRVHPDGRVEALGGAVSRYIRHDSSLEKKADLLPFRP